jgi:hypothetical protein
MQVILLRCEVNQLLQLRREIEQPVSRATTEVTSQRGNIEDIIANVHTHLFDTSEWQLLPDETTVADADVEDVTEYTTEAIQDTRITDTIAEEEIEEEEDEIAPPRPRETRT